MQFVNHTPFPAQAFAGVEEDGARFHVLVLRQTLTWGPSGGLTYTDAQAPLCEVDETLDGSPQGCVRQESDLCQSKPRCDVIVNADAHAPLDRRGAPVSHFQVRLLVQRVDAPNGGAPPPQRLNSQRLPAQHLIDKTLHVTGARDMVRKGLLERVFDWCLKWLTLGFVRRPSWKLTRPSPQSIIPLDLRRAFGGECRIPEHHPAAAKVPPAHRLTPQQRAAHPDATNAPIAHEVCRANPLGMGHAAEWFLRATRATRLPAPQIEPRHGAFTSARFDAMLRGQQADPDALVAGLGVRPKAHPDRARLVGRVDRYFVMGDAPLPEDFDFAIWNAAWPDQQIDHLEGNEVIGLMNLCSRDTPAAWQDDAGNTLLRLSLPGQVPYVLVRYDSGAMAPVRMMLDTVIVEPASMGVSLVFRITLPEWPAVRCLEARQMPLTRWQAAEDLRQRVAATAGTPFTNAAVEAHG